MAAFKRKIREYLIIILQGMILTGCANQLPPSGGPVDLVPPKILKAYPETGATNFPDNYMELNFSKYIDKQTLKSSLFISPAVEGDLDFDWTGTSVKITFPKKLKKNITYVFTIGTDLEDYNNHNKMAQAYNITFSTGNKIDKGEVTGKVFDNKPEGVMIFAYIVGDSVVNPMVKKPDYISQTGTGGTYKLLGLAPATYRIYAVRDEAHDLMYHPEQDEIGNPVEDVKLTELDTLYQDLNFFLTKVDTVKPRFISAAMTDKFHVLVNFSKGVDSSIIRSNNFKIIDSTSGLTVQPVYVFKGNTKPTEIVLVTKNSFPAKDEVYLFADSIIDKFGNVYIKDYTPITLSEKADSTKPGITNTKPARGSGNVDYFETSISLYFNDAFDTSFAKNKIAFTDTSGKKIIYSIFFIDDASFKITPLQNLEANTDYTIKLDLSGFTGAAGIAYDTVYQFKFRTINGLDFTGVSGTVENADFQKNPNLILQGLDEGKYTYQLPLKGSKKFNFDRVQAGKYCLWDYYDTDSSKTYSFGKSFPYKPSEQFYFYPDTLNLRPRWSVTNAKFIFKK
ncbi:MAG: Ig-like domain-containing protein [Ignavibacteriaceae bacterium]